MIFGKSTAQTVPPRTCKHKHSTNFCNSRERERENLMHKIFFIIIFHFYFHFHSHRYLQTLSFISMHESPVLVSLWGSSWFCRKILLQWDPQRKQAKHSMVAYQSKCTTWPTKVTFPRHLHRIKSQKAITRETSTNNASF